MRYNTDLFDQATIARMSRHFEILLGRIIREPTANLDALMITLADDDRRQQTRVREERKEANSQKLRQFKRKTISALQLSSESVPRKQNHTNANRR